MSIHHGVDVNRPFGYMESNPVGGSKLPAREFDKLDHNWQWLNSEGSQSGSHPAKSQGKTLRPFSEE